MKIFHISISAIALALAVVGTLRQRVRRAITRFRQIPYPTLIAIEVLAAVGTVLGTVPARVGLHAAPVARVAAPLFNVSHLGFAARRSGKDLDGYQRESRQDDG